jgi:peroxiredoxin family protein
VYDVRGPTGRNTVLDRETTMDVSSLPVSSEIATAASAKETQRKASIIVFSGDLDKLMAAYIVGTGAAAMGMDVVMFHTFWGLRAVKKNVCTGKGLFGRLMGLAYGGDITKATPSKFNFGGLGRWGFNQVMKANGVTSLLELRETAVELGIRLLTCEMSMELMEITREDLIDEVEESVGVATYLAHAEESQLKLFI